MSQGKGDLDIVKAGLQDRMRDVCQALLPGGREEGGQWVCHNPLEAQDHRKLPAFKVRLRGGVVGAWKDWRGSDKGDALGLVQFVLRTDVKGALAWSRDFLGLQAMSREDRERLRRAAQVKRVERDKQDSQRELRRIKAAGGLFMQGAAMGPAGPDGFAMTPAEQHARGYFERRNVPLHYVPTLNRDSFRFSAATEWWNGATWSNDNGRRFKTAEGPRFPAVHSAMRQWNGEITACHCTFLHPQRPEKAPVKPPKLMFGTALGAVIEIAMGWAETPFWQAGEDQAGPLILAEGIETALSLAIGVPEARVWACGSLAGVGNAPVALPCVEWVLFARDNNHGNRQAQKAFERAELQLKEKLRPTGRRLVVEASHVGDDFNDLATGEDE